MMELQLQRLDGADGVGVESPSSSRASDNETGVLESKPHTSQSQSENNNNLEKERLSGLALTWMHFSLLLYISDIGTDIKVSTEYYGREEYQNCAATLFLILCPSIINSLISRRMLAMDSVACTWVRCFIILFQFDPFYRSMKSLYYAWKSWFAERNKEEQYRNHYFRLMREQDKDIALLRVVEGFLEGAPQLVLQISILIRQAQANETFPVIWQKFCIVTSVVGLSLSMLSFKKNVRFAQEDKANLTFWGQVIILFWLLSFVVSRIAVLAAISSLSWKWALSGTYLHWAAMVLYLSIGESHEFCTSDKALWNGGCPVYEYPRPLESIANFCFSCVLGLVYIFTYITPGQGDTFYRHLVFYPLCVLENIIGMCIWIEFTPPSLKEEWFYVPTIVACFPLSLIGCGFMVLYYMKFHPSLKKPSGCAVLESQWSKRCQYFNNIFPCHQS